MPRDNDNPFQAPSVTDGSDQSSLQFQDYVALIVSAVVLAIIFFFPIWAGIYILIRSATPFSAEAGRIVGLCIAGGCYLGVLFHTFVSIRRTRQQAAKLQYQKRNRS